MAIRRGEQLLQSLRGGRQLFIDGDRVEDVTTDRRFAAAAQSLAATSIKKNMQLPYSHCISLAMSTCERVRNCD